MRAPLSVVLPIVAWSLVVAAVLLLPGSIGDDAPPTWLDRLSDAGLDKVVHAALFFVQALLLGRAFPTGGRGAWLAAALAAGYGLVLEAVQPAIPGRGWELGDVVANTIGAILWPLLGRAPAARR